MKKILKSISTFAFTFLMIACSVLFVACGKDNKSDKDNGNNSTTQTVIEVSTYEELKNAVENTTYETVKLKNDIDIRRTDMADDEFFTFNRVLTLDLNGKTITNTKEIWGKGHGNNAVLEISNRAVVTIRGNGKVISKEGDAYAIQVSNGGKVIIENGEFVGNCHSVYVHKGTAEIKGGKFRLTQTFGGEDAETGLTGYGFVLNCYDTQRAECSIIVSGGVFENFNPAKNIAEGPNTSFIADGYKAVKTTEGEKQIYTVTAVTE